MIDYAEYYESGSGSGSGSGTIYETNSGSGSGTINGSGTIYETNSSSGSETIYGTINGSENNITTPSPIVDNSSNTTTLVEGVIIVASVIFIILCLMECFCAGMGPNQGEPCILGSIYIYIKKFLGCYRKVQPTERIYNSDSDSEYEEYNNSVKYSGKKINPFENKNDSVSIYINNENNECSICHGQLDLHTNDEKQEKSEPNSVFDVQPTNIVKLDCNHFYHTRCIEEWYKTDSENNSKCPLCRSNITVSEYYTV